MRSDAAGTFIVNRFCERLHLTAAEPPRTSNWLDSAPTPGLLFPAPCGDIGRKSLKDVQAWGNWQYSQQSACPLPHSIAERNQNHHDSVLLCQGLAQK